MCQNFLIKQQTAEIELYQRYGIEFDFNQLFFTTGTDKSLIEVDLRLYPCDGYLKNLALEYFLDIVPAGCKLVTIERKEEV